MSEDIYVFEAIDLEPAVTESEIQVKIEAGEYEKVTWEDDGRIGDGYFVKAGADGMIGIAMTPELDESGRLHHRGISVEANPLEEDHRDSTIEAELRKIVDDFGTAPDGTLRRFERAVYIRRGDVEYRVFVRDGEILREQAPLDTNEPLVALEITKYEADLLRQMVALDIHDHKAGDAHTDLHDHGYGQRRIKDCEILLAKLNNLLD